MTKNFDHWNKVKKQIDSDQKPPFFNEREIWWCSIGINVGFEVFGKGESYARPVLIIKKFSPFTFLGVPMTSNSKQAPYRYPFDFAGENGSLLLDQVRVMDYKRLSSKIGEVGKKRFSKVKIAIKETF